MAYTYSKIATYTVGSGGIPSVSFLNIPQNYTDLILKMSARGANAATFSTMKISFNGVITSLNSKQLYSDSTVGGSSYTDTSAIQPSANGASSTANVFSNGEIYITNYSGYVHKCLSLDNVTENNATGAWKEMFSGLWANTSPITQIDITGVGNISQYSTFHLYGIRAEI